MTNRELRCASVTELRVATDTDGGLPVIEGHAAVFDSLSQDLGGIFPFKEKIKTGAFRESIGRDTVVALWNHDPNYVLGRNTAKTLELKETAKGLKVRIHPPDTQWAKDLLVSITRGDVHQMSFGFICEKESWSAENGQDVRTLEQVKLFDVSPVTFPAYLETDVGVRSALDSFERHKKELDGIEAKKLAEAAERKNQLETLKNKFKPLKEEF